jgi:hypothetical protein
LTKFNELMQTDGLIGLPAAACTGIVGRRICRVEDFKVHIIIAETGVDTPKQDGPMNMIFYGPKATLKLTRRTTARMRVCGSGHGDLYSQIEECMIFNRS